MSASPTPYGRLLVAEEQLLLSRLNLNAHSAARVCGVSVRQLTYWSDRGLIPTAGARRYGIATLNKVLLIKQALGQGYTLQRAVRLVEERLALAEAARTAGEPLSEGDLRVLVEARLADSLAGVRRCRQTLLAESATVGGRASTSPHGEGLTPHQAPLSAPPRPPDAKALALQLNRAIDDLADALEQLAETDQALARITE